jgi:hypothetical protein
VGIVVHQRPFPEKIEPAETGQVFFLAERGLFLEPDRPLINQEQVFPSLVFLEENFVSIEFDDFELGRDDAAVRRVQVLK